MSTAQTQPTPAQRLRGAPSVLPPSEVKSGFAEAERHWHERQVLEQAHANPTAEQKPERFSMPFWFPLAFAFGVLVPVSLLAPGTGQLTAALCATVAAILLTLGLTRSVMHVVHAPDDLLADH